MAEEMAQIIQVRSRESFVHRFHGDGGPREIEMFEEEIRHAWADDLSITKFQKVEVIRRYLGSAVKDELACYPAELIADPEKLLATLRRAYGECKSMSRQTLEFHQNFMLNVILCLCKCNVCYEGVTKKKRVGM